MNYTERSKEVLRRRADRPQKSEVDVTQDKQETESIQKPTETQETDRDAPTGVAASEKSPVVAPQPPEPTPVSGRRRLNAEALKMPFDQYLPKVVDHCRVNRDPTKTPLFEFTRFVKAHPAVTKLSAAKALRKVEAVMARWRKPNPWMYWLGMGHDDARAEFLDVWVRVRYLPGQLPLEVAIEKARITPLTTHRSMEEPDLYAGYDRFVSIAGHLQVTVGNRPILVPCELWATTLGVTKMTISRWRTMAVADGFLKPVKEASFAGRKATEFRFNLSRFPSLQDAAEKGTAEAYASSGPV